ncbi:cAMP-dependent protein kinase type I-alpha regulatory subunit-like isoform X1 [Schistocerca gregaria]|uniref:cAMP-dependent protein kinase type I-alpha regulatory subunit-like isoform X1 n=1 Tax=Schistocerca gregaria TaxID=7010 RepID=UPI00211EBEFF|nr:cAMP-dependent protein kinase type I-alpha regulatory subunit-like isoform X1 [Schistocerca gregaria]
MTSRTTTSAASVEEVTVTGEPKLRGKLRFRAVVRKVFANLYWLTETEEEEIDETDQQKILALKRKRGKKGTLSLQDKASFMKPAEYRSEKEREILSSIVCGLQCFKRYPEDVQKKLAEVTYLLCYGPGRVVVKQEGLPTGIYFILSGKAGITQSAIDPVSNEPVIIPAGDLEPGDVFGEISLIHDIPRTATVTTYTTCELLHIEKKDFDKVIEETIKPDWDMCKYAMARFPYFDEWSSVALHECCMLSRIKTYEPNETILACGARTNYVFFVLKGLCQIIQHLNIIVKETKKDHQSCRLQTFGTGIQPGEIGQTHFMQICILSELATFGLGENLTDRRIIALTPVECLLCPRYWIMQNNKANLWVRIKRFVDRRLPSTQQVFHSFVENRRWRHYSRDLVIDSLRNRYIPNDTSISDVPYSIRISEYYVDR